MKQVPLCMLHTGSRLCENTDIYT